MSTPITLTGAYTCTHHNDQQRAACPVCLVAALTTERDQLRFENATFRAAQKACEACDEPTAFEVQQLRAEAERTDAIYQRACEVEQELRADLAIEREKSERYRLASLKLDAELVAERARMDWLLSYDGVDWILWAHKNRKLFEGESDNRALLEAAMQEHAK